MVRRTAQRRGDISKRGNSMSRGAGRAKFFGAMILLKNNFTIEEVKKIIPMYA